MRKSYCWFTTIVLIHGFRIFNMNYDKHEWIEKNDLGDFALFVSDNFFNIYRGFKNSRM